MVKYIRWLSLDIVLGGVIFLNFIGDQLKVEVPIVVSLALSLCIWLIYTLDHQRDVTLKLHQKGARRIFHKKVNLGTCPHSACHARELVSDPSLCFVAC